MPAQVAATANTWYGWAGRLGAGGASPAWHGAAGWLFWGSYALLARYLFLNLCTLVVLYAYERTNSRQPWVAMDQVDEVRAAWQRFDRFGRGFLRTRHLARFLRLLPPPLGAPRDAPRFLADRHALRVLLALPPGLLGFEGADRDRDRRWLALRGLADGGATARGATALPDALPFGDVLVAVHEVALFPELQALPDDDDVAARRAFARSKLDVLRLAVGRRARWRGGGDDAAAAAAAAEADAAALRVAMPDLFRRRAARALAVEADRWERQIELDGFSEESYRECGLLADAVAAERRGVALELAVLGRLAARGALASRHEDVPRLRRHGRVLEAVGARPRGTRPAASGGLGRVSARSRARSNRSRRGRLLGRVAPSRRALRGTRAGARRGRRTRRASSSRRTRGL